MMCEEVQYEHNVKVHWNTVALGGDVPDDELKRMAGNSYELIKPKMRKKNVNTLHKKGL